MSDRNSMSIVNPEFSLRIVVCDHYLTKPVPGLDVIYSDFRGADIKQVPVLRIFGPSTDGRKACLHIHGVFPYFYIPCPTSNPEPQFLYQIAASLDKALNIALKQATSTNQHVYKISLVKGIPFYGFHDKDHLYLKVFLYSPNLVKQAVELCSNGAILGQTFQPHEAHLNFTLQFFIDFNLFGMSNIDLQNVKFRKTIFSQNSNEPIDSFDEVTLKPESICFYEADCVASHIINRQRVGKGDGIENPGLEEVWQQEMQRRKQLNMSIASKSLSQGRIKADETDSHFKFEQICLMKLTGNVDKPAVVESGIEIKQEQIYYPAESIEGTQFFNAVDVSIHLPANSNMQSLSLTIRRDLDETLIEESDQTIVDETVALNSSLSLHYSQVLLNSEDLDLVDMLGDMDDKLVEEGSVMGTPCNVDEDTDHESDDAEYSRIFNEETIIMDPYESKDGDETSPAWNDSFWDGANIPQLDGTCDDDHVKKVRKRKMRSFKLGLSKPKNRKNELKNNLENESESSVAVNELESSVAVNESESSVAVNESESSVAVNESESSVAFNDTESSAAVNETESSVNESDEINESQDTIDSISNFHFKKSVKVEPKSMMEDSNGCDIRNNDVSEKSVLDLVNVSTVKHEHRPKAAELYDSQINYIPEAGTSTTDIMKPEAFTVNNSLNLSNESSFNDSKITSFYNTSKLFDITVNQSMEDIRSDDDSDYRSETKENYSDWVSKFGPTQSIILTPKIRPPTSSYVISSLEKYNIPKFRNPQAYYSDPNDVGDKVEIGQMILKLHSNSSRDQKTFDKVIDTTSIEEWRQLLFMQTNEMSDEVSKPDDLKKLLSGSKQYVLEPVKKAPTTLQIKKYLEQKIENENENNNQIKTNVDLNDDLDNSQAIGLNDEIDSSITPEFDEKEKTSVQSSLQITMQPDGSFLCFGASDHRTENIVETSVVEVDYLTVMLTEVHTSIRGDLHPDPAVDPIEAIFIMITNDCPADSFLPKSVKEILVVDSAAPPKCLDRCVFGITITYVNNEIEIVEKVIESVKNHDPDIMCGYEIEMNSWGYILERAQLLGIEIVMEISRITEKNRQKRWRNEENEMEGRIIGRVTFNVWRLFRYELALSSYSFENCMYEVLKERVPKYSHAQLAEWWTHESRMLRWIPVEYYMTRLTGTVRMLAKLDIITMSIVNPEFSLRIVVCDHYLTKPVPGLDVIYSDFRGADIKQVPVLRIFGPSTDGRKACLHIHGVFPYFYIPCPTSNPEPQFLYQIAASLDKALNIALKQATSTNQHVYKISLVKGIPFYGFHDKDHLYLKVFLYSPNLVKQAVELCSNGAILGQTFQPHEAHLNFTLQFFIDFNLFGMSNIDLQNVKFRKTIFSQNSNEPIDSFDEVTLKPESICFYEADCVASHIINRQRVGKGDGIENPGLEEVWQQEMQRRKQLNMSIASKSLSQGRIKADETDSHFKFEQICLMKLTGNVDKPAVVESGIEIKQEQIYYPAESIEGTQFFNAVDVSIHLPANSNMQSLSLTIRRDLDETLIEESDQTIVDETVALNSSLSLHYSQVLLNSEDLDLVDMLGDMDDKLVEEGSVMGTPCNVDEDTDHESDDAEYSRIFNEETIIMDPYESKDGDETSPAWNDSFWDGANIPQLDGTCDDDHVKKVRKRKMRSFKLGLSKPKNRKNELKNNLENESESSVAVNELESSVAVNESESSVAVNESESSVAVNESESSVAFNDTESSAAVNETESSVNESDEINESQDTIDSISNFHFKKSVKVEPKSMMEDSNGCDIRNNDVSEKSVLDLVNVSTVKHEHRPKAAELYDSQINYIPEAGTSTTDIMKPEAFTVNNSLNLSNESSFNDSKITSFYNTSKLFDITVNQSMEDIRSDDDSDYRSETKENYSDWVSKFGPTQSIILTPKIRPPTSSYVISSLEKYNIPKFRNPQAYYSDPNDVGDKVEIGQMILKLHSNSSRDQKTFDKVIDTTSIEEWRQLLFMQTNEMSDEVSKPDDLKKLLSGSKQYVLEPVKKAPTTLQIKKYLEQKIENENENNNQIKTNVDLNDDLDNSQAIGLNDEIDSSITPEFDEKEKTSVQSSLQITMQPDGSFLCFGASDHRTENIVETSVVEVDYLTVMLTEVHTSIRGDLHPDPAVDPIEAIFIMITNDCPADSFLPKSVKEILVVDSAAPPKCLDRCVFGITITYVNNEIEIVEKVIESVKNHDPDIMCGYEIEMNSWGYILERAQLLGIEIVMEISRITEKNRQKRWRNEENEMEGRIIGRVTFNVWRLFRYELALSSYSFENCMYEVLKERVPKYSHAQLAEWWTHESRMLRWIPVEYYMTRLTGTVRMLAKLDIINRTSELARLFGMQWWEVLSRGSQFRVESLMLRAARPLNLVALSPTVRQRAAMRAPECLPLIFEPESRFYSDPVIVLDFQSLYPSMMIAYNYCFSTCIGRVQNVTGDTAYEFGAWRLRIPKSKLEALVKNSLVHWSPVGVGFVKASVRRGVLPALLRRILAARQAVKKSMKQQTDEGVKKAMHSRQLGLKLIANVTYGYTAANFSGRMPCVEVGDSVVAKGRETLQRAIKLVQTNKQWNARVVYGDTDSMFVQIPGGTRAEAFAIGQQIADAVTADNPSPVALKLEKVYQPCILQTKKRYVGFMYETPDQEKPVYEAKGIETVRRDGCPAGVKLLQRSLCTLFETCDMSLVKQGVTSLLSSLAAGTLPLMELVFTREYHGPAGYRPAAQAPPLAIAKRIAARDRRAVPRAGWRVRWVVVGGPPGVPLVRLARTPAELAQEPADPHIAYYAARVLLPPLHRCLSLLGADVFHWWREVTQTRCVVPRAAHGGIARYLWRVRCARCGVPSARALCTRCTDARALAVTANEVQTTLSACDTICRSCCGHAQIDRCKDTECPLFWRRLAAVRKLAEERTIAANLPAEFASSDLEF